MMGLRDFIHTRARQIQLVLICIFGAGIAVSSVIYFNTPPPPHNQAWVGNVVIDLKQLDYRLTYADLQSMGLFAGISCRKCDFPKGGRTVNLDDFEDPSFMTTLLRYQRFLYLNFYSADAPVGRLRFEEAARQLRVRFPGRDDAIRLRGNEATTAE